jgi:hypothetical protein
MNKYYPFILALVISANTYSQTLWYQDADNDGHYVNVQSATTQPNTSWNNTGGVLGDCDDNNPNIFEPQLWYLDADNDGYYIDQQLSCSSPGAGWKNTITAFFNNSDCNDADSSVNREQIWYLDIDNDGFYTSTQTSCICPGNGWRMNGNFQGDNYGDCNDTDSLINQVKMWFLDVDGDLHASTRQLSCESPGQGWTTTECWPIECDDSDVFVNELTPWAIDVDNDGYSNTIVLSCFAPAQNANWVNENAIPMDCDDSDPGINHGCLIPCINDNYSIWYLDADHDNYYISTSWHCGSPGIGWVNGFNGSLSNFGDCNDANPNVGLNKVWYLDADTDGHFIANQVSCSSPGIGWRSDIGGYYSGDCDDNNPNVFEETKWYLDADGDGAYTQVQFSCNSPGAGWVNFMVNSGGNQIGDCDDNDPSIFEHVWYNDADGDGHYTEFQKTCTSPGSGWVLTAGIYGDVNDANSNVWKSVSAFVDNDGDGYHSSIVTINIGSNLPLGYNSNTYGIDCNDNDNTIQTTMPSISISAMGNTSFCQGDSVMLIGNNGGVWSNGSSSADINVTQTGTYYVSLTNACGTITSNSIAVTVNPLPTASSISANGNTSFCEGNSITLSGNAGGTWSNGANTPSITVNQSGNYSVTNTNSCGSISSNSIAVIVNPLPNVGVTQVNNLLSVNTTNASYQWIDCNLGNSPIVGETNQNFTATNSGNYAAIISENGCEDTSACYSVVVTSIEAKTSNSFSFIKIYPNPTNRILFYSNASNVTNIKVFNSLGDVYFTHQINQSNGQIDVSNLSKGIYFIKTSENQILKFVKE